jgi:predicted Zn-dependent peptidase
MSRRKTESVRLYHVAGYKILLQLTPVPIVNVECAINAGFIKETKETSGVNHLLEHLLTEAWSKCGSTCIGYWTDKGVDMNASTDQTLLRYHTKGTTDYLDEMIAYITSISTHPIFRMKTLKKEKEAVIDEMLTYGNDPESKMDQVFNENFYTGGLVHKDDWKLQVNNLKHLDLPTLRKVYEENYNPSNILFIVTGQFKPRHVLSVFERELGKRPAGVIYSPSESCFSMKHDIVFTKRNGTTTKIVVGFPSTMTAHDPDAIYLNMICGILNNILFEKLRTELALVYGVHFTTTLNICGTTLMCQIYVRDKNVRPCLRALFKTLSYFQHHPFPPEKIEAAVQREFANFHSNLPYTKDYLSQYMHQVQEVKPLVHSKREKMLTLHKVTAQKLQTVFQRLYTIDQALLVYQGKSDPGLKWETLLS